MTVYYTSPKIFFLKKYWGSEINYVGLICMEKTRKQEAKVIKVSKGKAMVAAKKSEPVKSKAPTKAITKTTAKTTAPAKKSTPTPSAKKPVLNPIETGSMVHLTKYQCLPSFVIFMFLKSSKITEDLTPAKVNRVLQRLYSAGKICRLHSGVYCTQKFHSQLSTTK